MQKLTRADFDAGSTSISEIISGLWIGNLTAALDITTLKKHKISHILTVDTYPLSQTLIHSVNIIAMHLQISDLPYEDLLSHLNETCTFIEGGLEKGSVLVHCYYGVSRSVAVVIAFLMKKYCMSFDEAYKKLKEKREEAGPNVGFEHQLRLFETLKYTVDVTNLQYRMFRLRITADQVLKVKIVPQSCHDVVKPDPGVSVVKPSSRVYRCKKCRRVVASVGNLLPHLKNEKLSWKDSRWSSNYTMLNLCTETLFIEPLKWIDSVLQSESGKILCPKCRAKLGSFNWIMGSQCSCGAQVAPSFYLIPSKVDYSDIVQNIQATV